MKKLLTNLLATLGLAAAMPVAASCIPSGVTDQYTYFVAVDATDFTTRETGLTTFTVYRSRDGAAAAAYTTPTVNETDATNMPGTYELLLDEDMTIGTGNDVEYIALHITATGMAPVTKEICIARPKITAGQTVTASGGNANSAVQTMATNSITAAAIATDAIGAAEIAAAAIGDSELNVTGSEFTAVPWNASWDAEVQSEANDALVANNLDHLLAASVAGTDVVDDSVIAQMVGDDATADWDTFDNTTDSLEALRNRGDAAWTTGGGGASPFLADDTAQSGTASTIVLASSETFADDILNGMTICVDGGTGDGQCRIISDYVSSTDTATVEPDWTTNPSSDSTYYVIAGSVNVSVWDGADITTALQTASDIVDEWETQSQADPTGFHVNVQEIGGTAQTANDNGADINAILVDTAEIGSAGAGLTEAGGTGDQLTAVPYNSAWDAEIQSEANDAIIANNLDHLLAASVAGTDVVDDSVIAQLVGDDATADWDTFDNQTDSLEALRNRGDAAWTTGGGGASPFLADDTAQSGTASTIVLASAETFGDDILNGTTICVDGGTGDGQCRVISDYVGSTDTATVEPDWTTNPSSDSTYYVIAGSINVAAWNGSAVSTDVLTGRDIGLKLSTTVATVNSTTNFDLADGATNNDAYNDHVACFLGGTEEACVDITDYVAASNEITISAAPPFTVATSDEVRIYPPNFATVSGTVSADVVSISGDSTAADNLESYTDGTTPMPVNATQVSGDATAADNAESFFDGTGYAGTNNVIPTVTTLTGHTAQTGDSFARLGAPAGASVSADIAAIEAQTDDIGVAGAGLTEAGGTGDQLTAVPYNASWDAEIQSEATDALNAYDPPTRAELTTDINSLLAIWGIAEPGSVPNFSSDAGDIISWLLALSRNEINQTSTTKTIRNDADTGNIATCAVSDDGTTFTRSECN